MLDFNNEEKAVYLRATEIPHQTEKEIGVGDHIEIVINLYGENYYKVTEMGMGEIIGYVDRNENTRIEFFYDADGIVTEVAYAFN